MGQNPSRSSNRLDENSSHNESEQDILFSKSNKVPADESKQSANLQDLRMTSESRMSRISNPYVQESFLFTEEEKIAVAELWEKIREDSLSIFQAATLEFLNQHSDLHSRLGVSIRRDKELIKEESRKEVMEAHSEKMRSFIDRIVLELGLDRNKTLSACADLGHWHRQKFRNLKLQRVHWSSFQNCVLLESQQYMQIQRMEHDFALWAGFIGLLIDATYESFSSRQDSKEKNNNGHITPLRKTAWM